MKLNTITIIIIAAVIVAAVFIISPNFQSQSVTGSCNMPCNTCEDAIAVSTLFGQALCAYSDTTRCFQELSGKNYSEYQRFSVQTVNGNKVAVCSGGSSQACSDSDGGSDIYHKGTVTFATGTNIDYCNGASQVLEFYCQYGIVASIWVDCPDGYACNDGACVLSGATTTTLAESCSDTDGGDSPTIPGRVTFYNSAIDNGVAEDYCLSPSVIREGFCNGNSFSMKMDPCPSGTNCISGACVLSGATTTLSPATTTTLPDTAGAAPVLSASSSVLQVLPGGWAKLRGSDLTTNIVITGSRYTVLSAGLSDSNKRVDFKIDSREVPGNYQVYVTNHLGSSNVLPFIVLSSSASTTTSTTLPAVISTTTLAGCTVQASHYSFMCYAGNVYYYNNCNGVSDMKEYCNNGCSGTACLPSTGVTTPTTPGKQYYYYPSLNCAESDHIVGTRMYYDTEKDCQANIESNKEVVGPQNSTLLFLLIVLAIIALYYGWKSGKLQAFINDMKGGR